MAIQAIAFYVLSTIMVASGLAVVTARNPVHSVLFLFVVMMLDVDFGSLRAGFAKYLPLGGLVALVLLGEMVAVAAAVAQSGAHIQPAPGGPAHLTNTEAIGRVLYTDYAYFFQAAGMILLTAMIGAIVLTLRHRPGVKRQVVADQTARTTLTGMEIVKVKVGEGIDL